MKVNDTKDNIINILEQFKFIGKKEVLDIYYYDINKKELTPNKEGNLDQCLRLRKKDKQYFLTYKIDHFNNNIWSYSDEYEVEISDLEIGKKILEKLGLNILVKIENQKHTFLTNKYEIVFEDVKDLGLFLEVERLSVDDNENIADVKKEIRNFIKSLDIKIEEELNAGKPELMLRSKK